MRWSFVIPGEPRGKGRPRFSRTSGHAYTPKETEMYENRIAMCWRAEYPDTGSLIETDLEIWVKAIYGIPQSWSKKKQREMLGRPCRKKPDGDNILKAVCDGLNSVAYRDDVQLVEIHLVRLYGSAPRVEVDLVEVEKEE